MTGPEQHAATVREALLGVENEAVAPYEEEAIAALDELVALAGRPDGVPDGWYVVNPSHYRTLKAAEARADELQRERDEAREILDGSHARGYREGVRAEREQARREADQLRAALEEIARIDSPFGHSHGVFREIARAALAGVQAEEKEHGLNALRLMAVDYAPFLNIANPEPLADEYLRRAEKGDRWPFGLWQADSKDSA